MAAPDCLPPMDRAVPLPGSDPFEVDEKVFASAFEDAAIGMAVVAPDSRRLRVNEAFCRMLGFTEQEMMERDVRLITHPDDVAEDFLQRRLCLAGEKHVYQREKRYVHRDGHIVWGHLTCTLVRDADGRPLHFISQVQDISERKLAEEALGRSEERLRNVQGLLQMAGQLGRLGAWAYEIGQPCVTWSEEVCAIHDVKRGYSPTIQEALAFYAPEYRAMIERTFTACRRDGTPFDVETPVITAKGRRIWLRVIGEAQWDAQGRVVRLQGACQDISESKNAAEQARVMAAQLTMTLESLTDAFFTVDREWRFTYVNGEAERLMRLQRAQLLGRRMLDAYPELEELGVLPHLLRAMDEGVTAQFETYYPPYEIWVQVKVFPSEQGLAIDLKDITDRVEAHQEVLRLNAKLEQRVQERTAQLEAANKELEAFSYSIAHDLRAPLSSIDGFSQMLEQSAGQELGERCRHYLNRIRAGVRQMGDLTEGLLSLASLSRANLRNEAVDLAVLARAAVAACRDRAPGRAADIVIATALPVRGDPRLLSQVIGNLVGNAWKFTARSERARIEIGSMAGAGGETVYFVRDNGAGFDMAYATRMFEAFQRMHSPAEFEGTGVGLAIVHGVVTRHGGRIWAESAPQRGATFYFTLGRNAA
jgi:PAS domain S-box-containing protein